MIISALLATVLFYPSVVKEGDNLLDGAKWSGINPQSGVREYSMSRGGPFSVRDDVWKVNTFQETYGYWACSAEVRPDREYIAGYWVRFADARTLFWTRGRNAATGANEDYRLYCHGGGGGRKYLTNYISDEIKAKLGGDSSRWRLCFRMLRFPQGLKDNCLWVSGGCYLCEAEVMFTSPFLIDVTDCGDYSLTIDVRDSKPVSKLQIFRVGINDTVWEKHFDVPVTDAKIKVPADVADYRLGQEEDKNVINGHGLDVFYSDGKSEKIYAPQEHVFRAHEE